MFENIIGHLAEEKAPRTQYAEARASGKVVKERGMSLNIWAPGRTEDNLQTAENNKSSIRWGMR